MCDLLWCRSAGEEKCRVKLSLEKDNYSGPLVGFIWPSDTAWFGAKFIATANGPKLANLIFELKRYPQTEIRVIAHSLGARVTLSVLDSLLKNQAWSDRNFKISSVHLVGAAVDNEEVSTRPEDILIDETNWSSPKSDYGQAIGEEVINFPIYSVVRTTCLNHIPNSHLCQFILYLKVILLLDKVDMLSMLRQQKTISKKAISIRETCYHFKIFLRIFKPKSCQFLTYKLSDGFPIQRIIIKVWLC